MKQAVSLAVTTLALALTACGGDGSSPLGPTTKGKAEGLYEGTDPTGGYGFRSLILDTNEIWTVWGKNESGGFHIEGVVQGQGQVQPDKRSFTSSGLKDFAVAPPLDLSISATYVPGASFNGEYTAARQPNRQFSLRSVSASQYDYSAAAKLTDISGYWLMELVEGSRTSMLPIVIKVSGDSATLSGSTTNGCQFNGTIRPRASGKNVFDVEGAFKGKACVLPDQTVRGPAILQNINRAHRLMATLVDSNRSYGAVLEGS